MCATFAETESSPLLAEGAAPEDIAASVHRSVATAPSAWSRRSARPLPS